MDLNPENIQSRRKCTPFREVGVGAHLVALVDVDGGGAQQHLHHLQLPVVSGAEQGRDAKLGGGGRPPHTHTHGHAHSGINALLPPLCFSPTPSSKHPPFRYMAGQRGSKSASLAEETRWYSFITHM